MGLAIDGKKINGLALAGQMFYRISGSDSQITYSGKKFLAKPDSFTIPEGTAITYPDGSREMSVSIGDDANVECVGVNEEVYYFTGSVVDEVFSSGNKDYLDLTYECLGKVYKSEVKNIKWGG